MYQLSRVAKLQKWYVNKYECLLFLSLQQNHQPSTSQQAVRRKHPSNADNRPTTSHLHFKRLIKKRAENKFHFRHYEQLLHSNAMLFQQPMSKFQHRISSQFNFQAYPPQQPPSQFPTMMNPQQSIPLQKQISSQEVASNNHHYVTNLIANPQKNTLEVERNNGFHEPQQETISRPDSSGKDDEPTSSDHSSRSSTPSIQSLTDQTQIAQILDVST